MSVIKKFKVGNEFYHYLDENIAPEFDNTKSYQTGDYVINPEDGLLYKFFKNRIANDSSILSVDANIVTITD